jgi:DeoR/GlpR family transcriptional regulator of sugar metabolism
MTTKQRLDFIERYIRENKYADLHTLAESCDTSVSTIRRALDTLEGRGLLRRHHGGATLVETDEVSREYDFISRDQRNATEKHSIARCIADMVQPGMSVILDGGTTVYSVARLLAGKRLQVITNSLPIAALYADVGSLETIVSGGTIHNRLGALVGPLCEQSFSQIHVDLAILGGAGLTEAGLWNHNSLVVAAQRRMIAAAERTVFALDHTKFGRKALALTTALEARQTIVTDREPPASLGAALRAAKVTCVVAAP